MNFTHQHFIPSYGSAHINCTLYPVPLLSENCLPYCIVQKKALPVLLLRKNFCSENLQR